MKTFASVALAAAIGLVCLVLAACDKARLPSLEHKPVNVPATSGGE